MTCIEFFSQPLSSKDKLELLRAMPEEKCLAWEFEVASAYSPRPVSDEEILIRQIISPIHYDPDTNTLKSAAFTDASTHGLSVNRSGLTTAQEIYLAGEKRVQHHNDENDGNSKKVRIFLGVVQFRCGEIRKINAFSDEDSPPVRAFAVYDTAKKDDVSHADVCTLLSKEVHKRSVRLSLCDLANRFIANSTV